MSAPRRARPAPFRWDLVEESLEEAEFLWRRRQAALDASNYVLAELSRYIEERLLGCLDGVLVAGEASFDRLLTPALVGDSAALCSVATWCLASSGQRAFSHIASGFAGATGPALLGMQQGLELVSRPELTVQLEALRVSATPATHATILNVLAFHGKAAGRQLEELVRHSDPALAAAALRGARFESAERAGWAIEQGLARHELSCQLAALESGLVLGIDAARVRTRELLTASWSPQFRQVGALAAALGHLGSPLLQAALGDNHRCRAAAWALGFVGTRQAADDCVALITQGRAPQLAFDSFCAIVGCDGAAEQLAAEALQEDSPQSAADDDLDADLTLDSEASLAVPDPARVAAYWAAHRARFAPDQRYQRGRRIEAPSGLRDILWTAPLGRRDVTALELATRTRGAELVNPRAWCREQRLRLTQLTQATPDTLPIPEPG